MQIQLRQQMREQRRSLSELERETLSYKLADNLSKSRIFQKSRHIAFYLPNDGEIDLTPLINIAWRHKKCCYLPVLGHTHARALWFLPYKPETGLYKNRFGIFEPQHKPGKRFFKTQSLDLILLPLVAFDKTGNRLGMGGGFYDRTLSFLHNRKHWHKPHLIGAAYQFQQVEKLPARYWDVPLQGIATEKLLKIF
ncbi:MAG: 5-formyltetrahydrofolate cyclo-ligase [Gammaproteobacteria bacterium]|nr:5-formyltetrahydrofolate cyclo-ligase [Gammaproteobacteria bacterium]